MCDQDHFEDDLKEYTAGGAVSRRDFGALTLGAGMDIPQRLTIQRYCPL